jgi:hypothetical protein
MAMGSLFAPPPTPGVPSMMPAMNTGQAQPSMVDPALMQAASQNQPYTPSPGMAPPGMAPPSGQIPSASVAGGRDQIAQMLTNQRPPLGGGMY